MPAAVSWIASTDHADAAIRRKRHAIRFVSMSWQMIRIIAAAVPKFARIIRFAMEGSAVVVQETIVTGLVLIPKRKIRIIAVPVEKFAHITRFVVAVTAAAVAWQTAMVCVLI